MKVLFFMLKSQHSSRKITTRGIRSCA